MEELELVWITSAEYKGGYTLRLTFNDGKTGLIDLEDYTRFPAFESLKDPKLFQDFNLDGWTVTWLNGRLDIAPETLYRKMSS